MSNKLYRKITNSAADRTTKSERATTASSIKTDANLEEIRNRLDQNTTRIEACNASTKGLADTLRLQWLRDLGSELKSTIQKIFLLNVHTYRTVLAVHARLPMEAERSMVQFQEPLVFEDARGRIFPIHTQLIETWRIFDAVLESRFEGIPGYQSVRQKSYVLQNRLTKEDVSRQTEFCNAFLPGQKVDMSVILKDILESNRSSSSSSSCPRCQSITDTPLGVKDTTW